MTVVNKLNLPLITDRITEGKGNCFPIAILDQCKRPEVLSKLPASTKKIVLKNNNDGQMQLRIAVKKFIKTSDHRNTTQFRINYQENVATANNENWDQYWHRMTQDKVWADYIFIQATAWFLKHDIMIVTTSNTNENPIITISGNIEDESIPCPGATLTLGSKSNSHYQSLLPIEAFHLTGVSNSSQTQTDDSHITISKNNEPHGLSVSPLADNLNQNSNAIQETKLFKYQRENQEINFLITPDGLMQCYKCQNNFKVIVQHLKKSSECNNDIDIEDLKSKLAIFKQATGAQRQVKYREAQKI